MTMGVPPMINGSVAGADRGPRNLRDPVWHRAGTLDRSRTKAHTSPRSDPTSPASTTSRWATRSPLKDVAIRGCRHPRADADGARSGGNASRSRPPRSSCVSTLPPAIRGRVDRQRPRDIDRGLPRARASIPRSLLTGSRRRCPTVTAMTGTTSTNRSARPRRSSTRSWSGSPSSASPSAACRSSTRWPCRSPSGPVRSASSAPSAEVASRIVRELVTEAALIGFIGGAIGLALGAVVVQFANEAGRCSPAPSCSS